jgi:aryl-alcohol dehydrogenase-like predicted oxidoreductase
VKKLTKRFVLGTANLADNYGINNSNIIKNSSFKKIFLFLKKNRIFFIDTAYSYKNAEKNLSKFNLKNFEIISKLPVLQSRKNMDKVENRIINYVYKTLKNLKINHFYALLIHNTKDLKGKEGEKIFNTLRLLKKNGVIKKIGFSIYSPNELDKYFFKFKPDLVQGPLNIFDQRMLRSGWIKRLNNKSVEFHARSIFLQGLLLKKSKLIPKKFQKFYRIFDKYHSWLRKNNINSFEACLSFVFSIKIVDKIILGIDNVDQLNQIINTKLIKKKLNFKQLNCFNNKLINPSTW